MSPDSRVARRGLEVGWISGPSRLEATIAESLLRENPGAFDELLSSPPAGVLSRTIEAARFERLGAIDPEKALAQPAGKSTDPTVVGASQLAASWVIEKSAAATRWAASLPAGEVRRWTLRNLAASWLPLDTPAVEAWLRELPAAYRSDVHGLLNQSTGS